MKNTQPWDIFPLPNLYAFTSLKKARKFVKKITGLRFEPNCKAGSFSAFECSSDSSFNKFCVIYLKKEKSNTFSQKCSLLAHECTHYAQYVARLMETKFDDETEAYIVDSAMMACIDQIGEEWFATQQAK